MAINFYPRPPGGGRPLPSSCTPPWKTTFLSTPSGWRATLHSSVIPDAPLDFYPRPPGGGRPPKSAKRMKRWYTFLSTPSGWRATTICAVRSAREANFYPRPPGGGRPNRTKPQLTHLLISIHALRVEGDLNKSVAASSQSISIHALRVEGDLYGGAQIVATDRISIHALRVEGDPATERKKTAAFDFYPRPPGGGRLAKHLSFASGSSFLSTPSGWRATSKAPEFCIRIIISIHALRVEGDCSPSASGIFRTYFYPRPPGGGRLLEEMAEEAKANISIHALRVEGDR